MLKRNNRSNVRTAYTGVNHAPPVGSEPDSAARAAALTIGHARKEPLLNRTVQSPAMSRNPSRALSFSPSAPRPPLGSSRRNSYDPSAQDSAFLDNVNQLRDLRLTHEPRQERMVKKYIPSPSGIKVIEVPESTIRQEVSRSNLMRSMPRLASLRGPKRSITSRPIQNSAKAQSNPPSSSSSRLSSLQMRHQMRPVMESQEPSAELLAIQEKIDAQKRLAEQLLEKQLELERLQHQNQQMALAAITDKKDDIPTLGANDSNKALFEPRDAKPKNNEGIKDAPTPETRTANGEETIKYGAPELSNPISSRDLSDSIPLDTLHDPSLTAGAEPVDATDSIQAESPELVADEQVYVDAQATPPRTDEAFKPLIIDEGLISGASVSADPDLGSLSSQDNISSKISSSPKNSGAENVFVPIELRDSMIDHSMLDEDALDETFEASAMAKILRPQYGALPSLTDDLTVQSQAEPFPTERVLASDASTSLVYSIESPKAKPPVMKSAMKSASSFSHSIHSKSKESLAHQAYLLLTTAENTRLNAKPSLGNLPELQAQFKSSSSQPGQTPSPKRFSLSLRTQNGMVSPPATANSQGGMSGRSLRPATADADLMNRSRSGSGAALANRRERPQSYQPIPPHPALQPNYQLPSKIKAAELYAKAQLRPSLTFRPPQNRKSSFSRDGQEELADGAPVQNGPPPRTLRTPKQLDENGNEIDSYTQRQPQHQDRSHLLNQGQEQARSSSLRPFKSRIADSDDEEEVVAPASTPHGIVEKLTQPANFGHHHRLQLDVPQEQMRNVSSTTTKLAPSGEKKRFGKLRRLFGREKK